MHRKKKIEIAFGLALLAAVSILLVVTAPLPSRPDLNAALRESPVYYNLLKVSFDDVSITCRNGKVGATFTFRKTDGRPPVTVAGAESCSRFGTLVHWTGLTTRAREAYDPAMVIGQVDALFKKSGITENLEERYNEELGALLDKKYGALIKKAAFKQVTFSCEEAGDPFRYQAKYEFTEKLGEVSARCKRDNEEFEVVPAKANSFQPDRITPGFVHQYRNLDVAMVEQAYGEFLTTPLKKSF